MKLAEHTLNVAGVTALAMITDKVRRGVDVNGTSYRYSDKPFYMPFNKKIYSRLGGKSGEGRLFNVVHSKRTDTLGMIILGGYAAFKQNVYPDTANDFLTVTGKMLRNLKIIAYGIGGDSVLLGWNDPVQAQKAFWLNVSGAGKGRKLWKFFGLSTAEQQQLADKLAPLVAGDVAKQIIDNMKLPNTK
jgi:hypothetical protein